MNLIQEIRQEARRRGACSRLREATTLRDLARLLTSPHGREFCLRTGYPDPDTWRRIKAEWRNILPGMGIYIGTEIALRNPELPAVFIGTRAVVKLSGTDRAYELTALHGSHIVIDATDYAVCSVERDAESAIESFTDNTAIIL